MAPRPADDEVYAVVAQYLETRERLPWKTAGYLCRILRTDHECAIEPAKLETILLDRMGTGLVRYSQFPGRQSLDLLWGHESKIGQLEELWNPDLDAETVLSEIGTFEERQVPEDAEWVFLSHAFKDIAAIREIRGHLLDSGYGVWIAETHVTHGERIVNRVQEGLERAHRFALYATRQSLVSRWVLKEGGVAARRWRLPATVIVDRSDDALVAFFRAWAESGWTSGLIEEIPRRFPDAPLDPIAATDLSQLMVTALPEVDDTRCSVVLHPERPEDLEVQADLRWFRTLAEAFPG